MPGNLTLIEETSPSFLHDKGNGLLSYLVGSYESMAINGTKDRSFCDICLLKPSIQCSHWTCLFMPSKRNLYDLSLSTLISLRPWKQDRDSPSIKRDML